jgi:hypothetical protein
MPLWRTRVARSAAAARLHGAKIWRRGRCRALPMGSVSSGNADVASRFYTELWSGTFVLFLRVGAVSLSMGVLRLMTDYRLHQQIDAHRGVAVLVVASVFFSVCLHRWRIMRLLRRRELDRRLLGEMAVITCSLSFFTFLPAPWAM